MNNKSSSVKKWYTKKHSAEYCFKIGKPNISVMNTAKRANIILRKLQANSQFET